MGVSGLGGLSVVGAWMRGMETSTGIGVEELEGSSDVLGFARARRAEADAAEADVLSAAVVWAEQHPAESIIEAASWVTGGESALPLAGVGAPLVAEFCIPEFAAALGMSSEAGRALVAHAVELKYRLPRVWARVQAHGLAAWRARRVAAATLGLTREAAGFVDAQVAGFAHRIGPAALDRLVAEAVARFMPDQALADAAQAADRRHVSIHHDQVSFAGTTFVEGELDLADALDLEAALARGAEALRVAGCAESLDVRRSIAAGELARHQLALDLTDAADPSDAGRTADQPGRRRAPRQVVLYVHLCEQAITGTRTSDLTGDRAGCRELAQVENTRRGITAEQVRTWCANPDTMVTVKPVIDLDAHLEADAYQVPDRLRDQIEVRDRTCVFPWCARSARRCDCDHVIAHAEGGPTCSDNLAPLCRRHHRLKTHTPWTYTVLDPGTYLWSSPHGYQFLRDPTGTHDVTNDHTADPHPPER